MIKKGNFWFKLSLLIAVVLSILIIVLNPILSDVVLSPDQGSSWYYWKLPTRDSITMIIVWSLFIIHLVGNLYLLRQRTKVKEIGFHKFNLYLLIFNFIFILLHFVETIFLYDGLAQDVPIWSSQYSVIFILIILLVMQMKNRGLFFGKKISLPPKALKFLYKWHGILFLTAIVYTFWYHPIVFTIGHLIGFFYMFLLFTQVSFVKTPIHYNKYWVLSLEVLVAVHGASVAYFVQSSTLWAMFLLGFLAIFFVTQIYTLSINKWLRIIYQIIFLLLVITYYSFNDIKNIHQVLWIPTIEYLGALVIIGLCFLIFKIPLKNSIKHNEKF